MSLHAHLAHHTHGVTQRLERFLAHAFVLGLVLAVSAAAIIG